MKASIAFHKHKKNIYTGILKNNRSERQTFWM
jgi:hypothetical protein